jgi:hypothetical protein
VNRSCFLTDAARRNPRTLGMFSLVSLCPSLPCLRASLRFFVWRLTGVTAQSEFSGTCMSPRSVMAFTERSCSFEQDVRDISRISCMLFLRRGVLDSVDQTGSASAVKSRLIWFNRAGKSLAEFSPEEKGIVDAHLSPDSKKAAVSAATGILTYDLEPNTKTLLRSMTNCSSNPRGRRTGRC